MQWLAPLLFNAMAGIAAGVIVLAVVSGLRKFWPARQSPSATG
jgi:uncharacterized iron-regulated membrane protein